MRIATTRSMVLGLQLPLSLSLSARLIQQALLERKQFEEQQRQLAAIHLRQQQELQKKQQLLRQMQENQLVTLQRQQQVLLLHSLAQQQRVSVFTLTHHHTIIASHYHTISHTHRPPNWHKHRQSLSTLLPSLTNQLSGGCQGNRHSWQPVATIVCMMWAELQMEYGINFVQPITVPVSLLRLL